MKRKVTKPANAKAAVTGILGVGLDHTDGEKRITRTPEMLLVGGSGPTHERMQETAIKFSEGLQKTGRTLPETEMAAVVDLLRDAHRRTGG
ncbi:hypothetical protein BH11PLA2_BH11PLA2_08360 [soil metagenome]